MKFRKKSILYLLLVLAAVLFAGCSSNKPEKEPEEKQEKQEKREEKEPELKAVGTESTDGYMVKLKNVTGQDVTGVAIKDMDAKTFPENMLADGDVFAADEERNLFWLAEAASQVSDEETDPDEKVVIPGWDVSITLADGNSFVLHAFPFEEMKEGELHVEDGVAFVTYTCDVNTKEAEIMVKKQEEEAKKKAEEKAKKKAEEKAKKEAEEKAAAEAAAAEAAAAEAAAAEAARQQQQQQQPAQSSEQCIGGGGLTY
ncbi:hypothetical protein AALC75_26245 [Lachnospiraceae bacterium 48-42]